MGKQRVPLENTLVNWQRVRLYLAYASLCTRPSLQKQCTGTVLAAARCRQHARKMFLFFPFLMY